MSDFFRIGKIFEISSKSTKYVFVLFIIVLTIGLTEALILSPEDYKQSHSVRIMYVHVPAAWISLGIFSIITFLSVIGYIYGRKIKRNFRGETGTIKWFDPSKGYGFLIRDKGGDLFVHLRSVQSQDRRKLKENTRVRFSVEDTEKGPQAENIRII